MKQGKDGWLELDAEQDMQPDTARAYEEYRAAYRLAQEGKAEYERRLLAQMREAGLPESKGLVFGYNYGKASTKIVNASEVRKQTRTESKPAQTLADFLANQR